MLTIGLPISKSIANRLLMLQALHGDPLMEVSAAMPEDTILLHDSLETLLHATGPVTLHLGNCGTAMRFLTAWCAARPGTEAILTGDDRLLQRPLGQLTDALRILGADIRSTGKEGFLPVHIRGQQLTDEETTINAPQSSQFVSALLLTGVRVRTDSRSPYIDMTRACMRDYTQLLRRPIERDWSAAAFWYEWLALHPEARSVFLPGLLLPSIQGDSRAADLFAVLGVETTATDEGIVLRATRRTARTLSADFSPIPDLYPAVALTCLQLGIPLNASGTEALRHKESDRLAAIDAIRTGSSKTHHDHRIAMALMATGLPADDTECIRKSYPQFTEQLQSANFIHGL